MTYFLGHRSKPPAFWQTRWTFSDIRPHKNSLVYHPIQLKNAMRAGGLFFLFFLFSFVCPSPAAAGFKATKQSIN